MNASDPPAGHPDIVEEIFQSVRRHVLQQLSRMPPNERGEVAFTPQQLGIGILAAALQLCTELKVEPKDVERCISACAPSKLVLC